MINQEIVSIWPSDKEMLQRVSNGVTPRICGCCCARLPLCELNSFLLGENVKVVDLHT